MFFDPLYIILIVATLVISGAAQLYIRSTYGKWSQIANAADLTGGQVAESLRDRARFGRRSGREAITAIKVIPGALSDHFDPRDRSLALSAPVASQPSIASMAIAAHEVGHAQQVAEGSALMQLRSVLVPALSFGPNMAYLLVIGGVILNIGGLITIGIALFGMAVLFAILTLPVEIDASRKAMSMLESTGLLVSAQDREGTRAMLTAAALTYLAAAISAVLTLLYFLTIARRSD